MGIVLQFKKRKPEPPSQLSILLKNVATLIAEDIRRIENDSDRKAYMNALMIHMMTLCYKSGWFVDMHRTFEDAVNFVIKSSRKTNDV